MRVYVVLENSDYLSERRTVISYGTPFLFMTFHQYVEYKESGESLQMTRGTVTAFLKMELSHEILLPLFLTVKRAEGAANGTISIYEHHINRFLREYYVCRSTTITIFEERNGILGSRGATKPFPSSCLRRRTRVDRFLES